MARSTLEPLAGLHIVSTDFRFRRQASPRYRIELLREGE